MIKALSDVLPDEGRTVIVEIVNLTSRILTKGGDHFDHGGFSATLPAAVIPPFRSDVFAAESGGVAVGVEGWVTYTAEGAKDFTVHFDDPFLGSNSQSVQSNTDDVLSILGDILRRNHTHARAPNTATRPRREISRQSLLGFQPLAPDLGQMSLNPPDLPALRLRRAAYLIDERPNDVPAINWIWVPLTVLIRH